MKKRLRYAMPRVPLKQLKQQQKNPLLEGPKEKPISKLAALKEKLNKFFGAIKRKKNKEIAQRFHGEYNEDHMDLVGDEEIQLEDTMFAAAAGPLDVNDRDPEISVKQVQCKKVQYKMNETKPMVRKPLHINEDGTKAIRNAEVLLHNANRGRNLRAVVVDSDNEDGNGANEGKLVPENAEQHWAMTDNAESYDYPEGDWIVQADVHQVDLMVGNEQVGNVENTSARCGSSKQNNGQGANDASCENKLKMQNSGGARPKTKRNDFSYEEDKFHCQVQDVTKEAKERQSHRGNGGKLQREKPNETDWGQDESSESDGGWDCDDIHLLSR